MSKGIKSYDEKERRQRRRENHEQRDVWKRKPKEVSYEQEAD